jgi:hypothetical protein
LKLLAKRYQQHVALRLFESVNKCSYELYRLMNDTTTPITPHIVNVYMVPLLLAST